MAKIAKAFVKRWGSSVWKQCVWDQEYTNGLWTRNSANVGGRRDSVLEIIERYSAGREILELGCGGGRNSI